MSVSLVIEGNALSNKNLAFNHNLISSPKVECFTFYRNNQFQVNFINCWSDPLLHEYCYNPETVLKVEKIT